MGKDKYREYRILKIVKKDKYYWRPQYKDKKNWKDFYAIIPNTNILSPCDASSEADALKRIEEDKKIITKDCKYEIFDEIYIGKIKIVQRPEKIKKKML